MDDETDEIQKRSQPPAGGKVARLFESPYVIDSPEEPADLSYIGNGRGHLIDEAIAELIHEVPDDSALDEVELERSDN